jgi:transcriptional regulator with XRE-family HTH domain
VASGQLFLVSCKHCRARLMSVARLGDGELESLLDHARGCSPRTIVERPSVEEILRHVAVEAGSIDAARSVDWSAWMRGLGRDIRRARELVGLSQEQLARLADVSQAAISRIESGRGLATPLRVAVSIQVALVDKLRTVDPAILSDDLRGVMQARQFVVLQPGGAASDPGLSELIGFFRSLSDNLRERLLSVAEAAASAFARP